tara:strand:- start:187 stop:378 length:192 start_codon:yes stop_codon:yes gene_type:complete
MKIGCDGTIDKEGITETMLETMRRLWRRCGGGKGAVQEQEEEVNQEHRAQETRNQLGGTALSI